MLFNFYNGSLRNMRFVDQKEMSQEDATYRCQTEDLFMELVEE